MTKKLLIADDSLTIQRIVSLTFASEEIEVIAASDGESAIKAIDNLQPDIVLVDTSLPVKNGYEICDYIRSSQTPNIPTLLLIGNFESIQEVQTRGIKANGYLTKPFESNLLIRQVKDLIAPKPSRALASFQAGASASALDVLELDLGKPLDETTRASFVESPILEIYSEQELRILRGEEREPSVHPPQPNNEAATAPTMKPETVEANRYEPPTGDTEAQTSARPAPRAINGEGISGGYPVQVSEQILDDIVQRVIAKMSGDIIREIAWEVVPEMAERIIKEELQKLGEKK